MTAILKTLSLASDELLFSGPVEVVLLASGEGILSWLFMLVFLHWDLGIWCSDVGDFSWY